MKRILPWLLVPILLGLMLAIAYQPVPVEPYYDFQVIYHADMGLLRGIQLYDRDGQAQMIANLANVRPDQVILHPFPYPPWYALAVLPLALLPIEVAVRFWLELNIAMLLLSVWLMTDGWKPWKRLAAFPIALFFLPVLGALFVGQYVIPVLLGSALLIFALKYEKPFLTALAAALLTFKPHLGGLVLLALLIHLLLRRDAFSKRALWTTIAIGIFLFVIGFLADSAWPLDYLHSLGSYREISEVQTCDLCASLPVMVSRLFGTGGLQLSFWIAPFLLVGLIGLVVWKRSYLCEQANLVPIFTLITLLASPYLLNYDFVLLLVPLIILAGSANTWLDWGVISTAYFLSWLSLGLLGRQGNLALIISTLLLTLWLYLDVKKKSLDSPH